MREINFKIFFEQKKKIYKNYSNFIQISLYYKKSNNCQDSLLNK